MSRPAGLKADELAPEAALERFLASHTRRPPSYRAYRRLEIANARHKATGWLEVITEFDPDTGMQYRVLAEEARVGSAGFSEASSTASGRRRCRARPERRG